MLLNHQLLSVGMKSGVLRATQFKPAYRMAIGMTYLVAQHTEPGSQ